MLVQYRVYPDDIWEYTPEDLDDIPVVRFDHTRQVVRKGFARATGQPLFTVIGNFERLPPDLIDTPNDDPVSDVNQGLDEISSGHFVYASDFPSTNPSLTGLTFRADEIVDILNLWDYYRVVVGPRGDLDDPRLDINIAVGSRVSPKAAWHLVQRIIDKNGTWVRSTRYEDDGLTKETYWNKLDPGSVGNLDDNDIGAHFRDEYYFRG